MVIRYECPRTTGSGKYVLLDTETRIGTGYHQDGRIRWKPRVIPVYEEIRSIKIGTWAIPLDQQLPVGF